MEMKSSEQEKKHFICTLCSCSRSFIIVCWNAENTVMVHSGLCLVINELTEVTNARLERTLHSLI